MSISSSLSTFDILPTLSRKLGAKAKGTIRTTVLAFAYLDVHGPILDAIAGPQHEYLTPRKLLILQQACRGCITS